MCLVLCMCYVILLCKNLFPILWVVIGAQQDCTIQDTWGDLILVQHQYNNCTTIPHMRIGPSMWDPPSCEELLYSCCIGVVNLTFSLMWWVLLTWFPPMCLVLCMCCVTLLCKNLLPWMSGQEGYISNLKTIWWFFFLIIRFPRSRIREKIFAQQGYTAHAQHKTYEWDSCE
jgi:hypothetical protein